MTRRPGVLLLCLSVLVTACAGPWWVAFSPPSRAPGRTAPPTEPATPLPTEPPTGFGMADLAVGERNTSPVVSSADLRTLVTGNTAFAIDLYQRAGVDPKAVNLAIGPYSISAALAMLEAGAAGKTRDQLRQALHDTLPDGRLDTARNALSLALSSRNTDDVTVSIADRAFGQQGYPFRQSFLRRLTTSFDAPMAALDYRNEWELDRQLINQWVSDATRQAIDELIPNRQPPYINADTRLALVNAMYLNAIWAHPFPVAISHTGPFVLIDGSSVQVPFMEQDIAARFAQNDTYQAIELPYKGGQLSMLLVMPMTSFRSFTKELTPGVLSDIEGSLHRGTINVLTVPRFTTRTRLDLTSILHDLGVTDAFDRQKADLSGVADPADIAAIGEHPLYVTGVLHQASITVGEKGTEAAASTGAFVGEGGPLTELDFNQPFLWFIRDRDTGSILFLGRVIDPRQQ